MLGKEKNLNKVTFTVQQKERLLFLNTQLSMLKIQMNENQDALQKARERREYFENLLQSAYVSKENELHDQIQSRQVETLDLQSGILCSLTPQVAEGRPPVSACPHPKSVASLKVQPPRE